MAAEVEAGAARAQGRGKQNKHRRWGRRNVTPPSMNSGSKASTYGKAKGHANHWAKLRRCPRRLVKKGRGDRVIHPLG